MNIGYAQFEYELIIRAAWITEKLRRAATVQSAEGLIYCPYIIKYYTDNNY